jgi:hypothetical protein
MIMLNAWLIFSNKLFEWQATVRVNKLLSYITKLEKNNQSLEIVLIILSR